MIFRIASIIIAKIAASMPHIPNQNTSDRMINNGFSVKRRASSMGVSDSPSCQSRGAGGSKAHHKLSKLSIAGDMQIRPVVDDAGHLRREAEGRTFKQSAGKADGPGVELFLFVLR
jgi:hypothetical protein